MEITHANLDVRWFRSWIEYRYEASGSDSEADDDGGGGGNVITATATNATHDTWKAKMAEEAQQCIGVCTEWIDDNQGVHGAIPHGRTVWTSCTEVWRDVYHKWRAPCGNHLNVPDLMYVASCFLHVATRANPLDRCLQIPASAPQSDHTRALLAYIKHALQHWDRQPSILHSECEVKLNLCARTVVFWASGVDATPLLDTRLSAEDISLLTMNVNVHQNLDNRARNTDRASSHASTEPVASATGVEIQPDAVLLQDFVRLASRYAFFATLHRTAQSGDTQPMTSIHRRLLMYNLRDLLHTELLDRNTRTLREALKFRRSVALPDTMRRRICYTIWKRSLSVGSIESYLRMAPTTEWQKVNPITVAIREPTAATASGALMKAVAGQDDADPTWPARLMLCREEVWDLAMWHLILTDSDVNFMDDKLVFAHDLREKAHLIGCSTVNLRPRLPVLVHACGAWCVHAFSHVWHTGDVIEAIYVWAWLIVHFYDGKTETGSSLETLFCQRAHLTFY